jgi:hypothetical protein
MLNAPTLPKAAPFLLAQPFVGMQHEFTVIAVEAYALSIGSVNGTHKLLVGGAGNFGEADTNAEIVGVVGVPF